MRQLESSSSSELHRGHSLEEKEKKERNLLKNRLRKHISSLRLLRGLKAGARKEEKDGKEKTPEISEVV